MLRASFLLFLFCTASCSSPSPSQEKVLRLPIPRDPLSFDPGKAADASTVITLSFLFEGLFRQNEQGEIVPAQAASYTLSKDRKTYLFHLQPAHWSNGEPVTAYDYEVSWKRQLHPSFPCPSAYLFYVIRNAEAAKQGALNVEEVGIRALDKETLRVDLEKPTTYFLHLLTLSSFYPVFNGARESETLPITNGPYTVTQMKPHWGLKLQANPFFLRREEVKVPAIELSIIANENLALELFHRGELDFVGAPLTPLLVDAQASLRENLNSVPAPFSTYCSMNVESFPFTNRHFRRALALAINRQALATSITFRDGIPASLPLPPLLTNRQGGPLDAETASEAERELSFALSDFGMTLAELPPLVLHYSRTTLSHQFAQELQEEWRKTLGLKVTLQSLEYKVLLDGLIRKKLDFCLTRWIAEYPDPMSLLDRFRRRDNLRNYPNWESPHYAALLNEAECHEAEERMKLLALAEDFLLDEMPLIPLCHDNYTFLVSKRLSNLKISPFGYFFFSTTELQ